MTSSTTPRSPLLGPVTCLVAGLLALAACGDDSAATGTGGGATTGTGGAGSGGSGDGGGGTGGAPTDPPVADALCNTTCDAPEDCGTPADQWACDAGFCRFLGCTTDADCAASPGTVCRSLDGAAPQCLLACEAPADCGTGMPPFLTENFACTDGACDWRGCNGDDQCSDAGGFNPFVCRPTEDGRTACFVPCEDVADCGDGRESTGVDNYACHEGVCRYTGCNGDEECQADLGAGFGCGPV